MGVVYRARHLRLDRIHALKVIAPEYAQDLGFRNRFEREARLAAAIDHPHVIGVHNAGEEDGRLYLAMQFVEGSDLRAELARCGRLQPERAIAIVAQVASALDAAHAKGLVHRDVKPANVLLAAHRAGDYVYLSDFGLTKRLDTRARETGTGMFVGTTDYIAPEQLRGADVDARTDVYSLACVVYQMLSGQVPYPRDHDLAAATAHLTEAPPSLGNSRPELATRFDPIIRTAMAKDPDERYSSAGGLAAALQEAAALPAGGRAETVAARRDDPTRRRQRTSGEDGPLQPEQPRRRSWWRRHPLVAVSPVVLVVALAAALWFSTPASSPGKGHSGGGTRTQRSGGKKLVPGPALGPQLTANQLKPVLVSQAAWQGIVPSSYDPSTIGQDTSNYALQGGLPALKLCSATIPAPGLGADVSSAYDLIGEPTIYYASDAASFAGQGAKQLVSAAAAQAPNCGWRSLPGPQLDDQVVRLTMDQNGPTGTPLHDDVILVRDGAAVTEVATATVSGTHSADAESLAQGAAQRLAQAEHGG